ncbi:MAG: hypothetical protein ABIJ14_01590 [Nanoarchaeota archaeon]
MTLTKRILDFLNKDVSKLFKREYICEIVSLGKDDCNREVIEMRRYDKKIGVEIPYATFPPRALAVCLENRISCYN